MLEIDGNQPSRAVLCRGQSRRQLQHPLGLDEIDLEARSQGIASPTDPGNVRSGLAQQGIIHRHHQRFLRGQLLLEFTSHDPKDRCGIKASLTVEAILSGPIPKSGSGRCRDSRKVMASQTNQLTQQMMTHALPTAMLASGRPAKLNESF